ncbi:MAG TPA: DUF2163 domain-containing protein [Scandinavium sp.]|uniref:DUF2163 domain-containing protein n=1 Tax=Scandinavium sp. TaxID=2830653 RepID=UPI002E2EB738|nr:DUF2163 domain-containing protein [Scandinavium sp.]HEX4499862.1 DUF2163 domain-containing protein [Scandinavium sp.]
MKTVPSALASHLSSELTTTTTLWLITRRDGQQFAFTEHDQPLTVGAITYQPGASYQATAIRTADGMKLDTLDAKGVFDSAAITDADLQAHLYDSATVVISLVNWASPSDGAVLLRQGTIGTVTRKQNTYQAELRGMTAKLHNVIGETFQPGCRADLGDARCKVDLRPLTQTGAVAGVIDQWSLQSSGISGAGPSVMSYTATTISLEKPHFIRDSADGFLTAPHVFHLGDAVEISGTLYNNTTHGIRGAVYAGELITVANVTPEKAGNSITLAVTTPGYFDFGLIKWTSGANNGLTMDVKSWDGTNLLKLVLPMPHPIALGDTFTITPGCDKRVQTCVAKYNNVVNFRGEPFVPGQDAALAYPNSR